MALVQSPAQCLGRGRGSVHTCADPVTIPHGAPATQPTLSTPDPAPFLPRPAFPQGLHECPVTRCLSTCSPGHRPGPTRSNNCSCVRSAPCVSLHGSFDTEQELKEVVGTDLCRSHGVYRGPTHSAP